MQCPFCNSDETRVIDTRSVKKRKTIRRRRECINCKKRFTTYERCESYAIMVIKKNGTREFFNRQKILNGMKIACQKRSVSMEELEEASLEIEQEINNLNIHEIESSKIGDLILEKLKSIDDVAFVRFASVYQDFKSPEDFIKLLDSNKMND